MSRGVAVLGCLALLLPVVLAAFSPLLAWRGPVYIAAGFAGILAMVAMVVQPLAIGGALPELSERASRRLHRWGGGLVTLLVALHVILLWVFSPPDVIDALLLMSPTPFSIWGVLAMWAVFGSAGLAILRLRKRISWKVWRRVHGVLVAAAISGTILHVVLVHGTMEQVTKYLLCVALAGAAVWSWWRR